MKIINLKCFFRINYWLCLVLLIPSLADAVIPAKNLANSDFALKPGYEYMSPVLGYFLRNTNILTNLRFNEFIAEAKDSSKDKSEDPLIRIIIQLFPSRTGTLLPSVHLKQPEEISAILNAITYYRQAKTKGLCTIKPTKSGITCAKHKRMLNAQENSDCTKYLQAFEPVNKELKNFLKRNIVEYFILENLNVYPEFFIEQVVWAYALEKFDNKDALNTVLHGLDDSIIDKRKIDAPMDNPLNTYGNILPDILEKFEQHSLIPYINSIDVINNGRAYYFNRTTGKLDEEYRFADCGETVIRHLFNIALFDHQRKTFDLQYISKIFDSLADDEHKKKHPLKYLIKFYSRHDVSTCASDSSIDIRSEWNKITASIEGVNYDLNKLGNDIDTTDENLIKALTKILNIEIDHNLPTIEQYESILTAINPNKDIKLTRSAEQSNFNKYFIAIDGIYLLTLKTSEQHAEMLYLSSNDLKELQKNGKSKSPFSLDFNPDKLLLVTKDKTGVFHRFLSDNNMIDLSLDSNVFIDCFKHNTEIRLLTPLHALTWIKSWKDVMRNPMLTQKAQNIVKISLDHLNLKVFVYNLLAFIDDRSKLGMLLAFPRYKQISQESLPIENLSIKERELIGIIHASDRYAIANKFSEYPETPHEYLSLISMLNQFNELYGYPSSVQKYAKSINVSGIKMRTNSIQQLLEPYGDSLEFAAIPRSVFTDDIPAKIFSVKTLKIGNGLIGKSIINPVDLSKFKNLEEIICNFKGELSFSGKSETLKTILITNTYSKIKNLNSEDMPVDLYLVNHGFSYDIDDFSNISIQGFKVNKIYLQGLNLATLSDIPDYIKNIKANTLILIDFNGEQVEIPMNDAL